MGIGGIELNEDVLLEDYFELASGIEIKNLRELANAIKSMKKNDFDLHVTKSRNDFAEWVMEVYFDDKLTEKLLRCRDKEKMAKILKDAIKNDEKILKISAPKSKKQVLKKLEGVSYEM